MKKAKLGRAAPEQRERARLRSLRWRRAHGIGPRKPAERPWLAMGISRSTPGTAGARKPMSKPRWPRQRRPVRRCSIAWPGRLRSCARRLIDARRRTRRWPWNCRLHRLVFRNANVLRNRLTSACAGIASASVNKPRLTNSLLAALPRSNGPQSGCGLMRQNDRGPPRLPQSPPGRKTIPSSTSRPNIP
jgi:hypothetical protein